MWFYVRHHWLADTGRLLRIFGGWWSDNGNHDGIFAMAPRTIDAHFTSEGSLYGELVKECAPSADMWFQNTPPKCESTTAGHPNISTLVPT